MLGTDRVTSATPSDSPQATSPESAHARAVPLQATGSESIHTESIRTASPTFSSEPPPRAVERWAYEWVDNRLKVMSVLLPVGFIIALEFARFMLGEQGFGDGFHLLSVGITVICIIVFGLVMFRFIDRAQRQVVRQNRELAATNAVTNAVQGEAGVDRIIDVVLDSLLTTSGAAEASVTISDSEDSSPAGAGVTRRRLSVSDSGVFVPADPRDATPVIDIPLATGALNVGRMRLQLRPGADDCLASGTLQNIGHQLASAIQRAQLVADLNRRKHEGHAFYDVLLQISNQNAPPDILSAVVLHARDMMGSDEAVLSLNEDASRSVQFAGTLEGGTAAFNDGTDCITSETGPRHIAHGHNVPCPVRSSTEWTATTTVPIRGPVGSLGELWIGRRSGVPFTERDRAFLVTLSGLAAIAITAAQMRENGRQRAVLAERGRIAREMHDSLAQVLGVTHLRLRALDAREEVRDSREIAVELAALADICQEAYRDVRESILGLRGSNRAERGLLDNLSAYLAKYSQQCEIATTLDSDIDHDLALSPRCEVQVIRVIQEALTNVRKHSGAKSAVVRVTETSSTTTFVVEDDGHGFDPGDDQHERDGFGLYTMRERMALLNGSLRIDSAPGRGTRVIADIPERSHPRPVHDEVKDAAARTDTHPAG